MRCVWTRTMLDRSLAWCERMSRCLLVALVVSCVSGCDEELNNHAAYFGWGGKADTDLEMRDFFHGNHTLAAWFMPQYTRVYTGPILSNSGSASTTSNIPTFYVGLGNYKLGAQAFDTEDDITRMGQPLVLKVGAEEAYYTPDPVLERERWYHLAVTRNGCTFRLYLDGELMTTDDGETGLTIDCDPLEFDTASDSDVVASSSDSCSADTGSGAGTDPGPVAGDGSGGTGTVPEDDPDACDVGSSSGAELRPDYLRIGRAKNGHRRQGGVYEGYPYYYTPQFYGLVDDVAVFSRVLSASEIQTLAGKARVDGTEPGLLAAWTFDSATPWGGALPDKLDRFVGFYSAIQGLVPCGRTLVSLARDSSIDKAFLPTSFHFTDYVLPFAEGEVWRVSQGYGGRASHNGLVAFSLDFDYVKDSFDKRVYAAAGGEVAEVNSGQGCGDAYLRWRTTPGELLMYMHLANDSSWQAGDAVAQGDEIYTLGKYDPDGSAEDYACDEAYAHLHLESADVRYRSDGSQEHYNSFPIAFRDYEVSDNPDGPWTFVARGTPRENQWVKKPSGVATRSGRIFASRTSADDFASLAADLQVAVHSCLGSSSARESLCTPASGQARVDVDADTLVLEDLSFSLAGSRTCMDLELRKCAVPPLPVEVRTWDASLRGYEPILADLGMDGTLSFGAVSLDLIADLTVDAGVFGIVDVRVTEPVEVDLAGGWDGDSLSLELSGDILVRVSDDLPAGVDRIRVTLALDSTVMVLSEPVLDSPIGDPDADAGGDPGGAAGGDPGTGAGG